MVAKIDLNFLSNRNIKFENKKGKWLSYKISENGTPVKINVRKLLKAVQPTSSRNGITGDRAFSCYGGRRTATEDQKRYELAMGIKHTLMERNVYVINSLIDEKNKKMQTIWMKILHFIVKIFTCGKVNLIEKLKYKKITTLLSFPNPDPKIPEDNRRYGWTLREKLDIVMPDFPALVGHVEIKESTTLKSTQEFIRLGGQFEKFIHIDDVPGWSIQELYQMDPQEGYRDVGDHWINGHRLDKV